MERRGEEIVREKMGELMLLCDREISFRQQIRLQSANSKVEQTLQLQAPPSGDDFVAVKSASFDRADSLRREEKFLQELRGCQYVIQGLGADISMEDEGIVYNLVMEYASGGSLKKMIRHFNGNMPEPLVASFTYMLLKGLLEIHHKDIVHCDIKPANILVVSPQSGGNNVLLKIADFGLSRKIWDDSGKSHGTPIYAPPEAVRWGLNGKAGDIWSLGCVVVEMITGKPMWEEFKNLGDLAVQIANENPTIPENILEDAKDFLGRCLARNRYERWSVEKLLNHPFVVKNLNYNDLVDEMHPSDERKMPWISTSGTFSIRY